MSDNKSGSRRLELITTVINDLARELGSLDRGDTRGALVAAELSQLMQLKRSIRLAGDSSIGQWMDELAREMATLRPGDSQRKQVVEEIMRLARRLKDC